MTHRKAIIELIGEGKSNKEISEIVGCSDGLVSIYRKEKTAITPTNYGTVKLWHKNKRDKYISDWKIGRESGAKPSSKVQIRTCIREYIFLKYDKKCYICGWNKENSFTKTIPLEIHHIDGNPSNHKESNLVLLCPNCHSLTKEHSTKKGNGRQFYT